MNVGNGGHLFNVINENQLTSILSHYNSEYVLSIVASAITSRFNTNSVIKQPNVVAAWEQNFKQLLDDFEDSADSLVKIKEVRENTYREIIEMICREFHLNFTIDENVDWYSAAYYLYDFFVCNFNSNIINFYARYIYNERREIYDSLGLENLRKNKDTSTQYGKRIYKDIKLAIINANIDYVVTNLFGIDINLSDIFEVVYSNNIELVKYLCGLVTQQDDFYQNFYVTMMQSPMKPILLTEIRFAIQSQTLANGNYADEEDTETEE